MATSSREAQPGSVQSVSGGAEQVTESQVLGTNPGTRRSAEEDAISKLTIASTTRARLDDERQSHSFVRS